MPHRCKGSQRKTQPINDMVIPTEDHPISREKRNKQHNEEERDRTNRTNMYWWWTGSYSVLLSSFSAYTENCNDRRIELSMVSRYMSLIKEKLVTMDRWYCPHPDDDENETYSIVVTLNTHTAETHSERQAHTYTTWFFSWKTNERSDRRETF